MHIPAGKKKNGIESLLLNRNSLSEATALLVVTVAAAVVRDKKLLQEALAFAKQKKREPRFLYEGLLQCYLFAGFPNAMESLSIFNSVFPGFRSAYKELSDEEREARGLVNADKVYGSALEKLLVNVKRFSPELAVWLISEGYGKVYSREGLPHKEREIAAATALMLMQYDSQLFSHMRGMLRAGASEKDILDIINLIENIGRREEADFGTMVLEKVRKRAAQNEQ